MITKHFSWHFVITVTPQKRDMCDNEQVRQANSHNEQCTKKQVTRCSARTNTASVQSRQHLLLKETTWFGMLCHCVNDKRQIACQVLKKRH